MELYCHGYIVKKYRNWNQFEDKIDWSS